MSPRLKLGVVFSSMLLTLMLVVGAVMGKGEEKDSAYKPLSVYTEVLARIKSDYVEEPDIDLVTRGALQGLVEYLDPLSSYLSPEQYAEYASRQGMPDGGAGWSTGLVVHKRGAYTTVMAVFPGSSADDAGIEAGDLIEAIDDRGTRLMPPALLQARLSGEIGSEVKVLVRTATDFEDPDEYRLVRKRVVMPPVESRMIEGDIAYVRVKAIDDGAVSQTAKSVKSLTKQGAKHLVLDLRGSAVGSAAEGVALADLFVDEGRLATLRGQQSPEKTFDASAKATVSDLPMAVIVDRPTSRGAEIAAAALVDRGRAELVGERTYGLAAEQSQIPLDDGAALILSTAIYYRDGGEPIHDQGLDPEHKIDPTALRRYRDPDDPTPKEQRDDPFRAKAVEVLRG